MQNSVIYGILVTLLSGKEQVSRDFLARKYEVSERTIRRYIDTLIGAGVPVRIKRGRRGGYSIASSYRLEQSFFSSEEYERMLTCLHALSGNFPDNLNRDISDKLAHLDAAQSDQRKYLVKSDSLVIEAGTWNNPHYYRGRIETVNRGIYESVTLSMRYTDRNEHTSERLFDPYSLVMKEGSWYAYGYCHERADFRLFRLSRMRRLSVTGAKFVKRDSDVYAKLNEKFDDAAEIEISLEFTPAIRADVEEWLGEETVRPIGDNFTVRAQVYSSDALVRRLLSFGPEIKVLKPAFLAEELKVNCKRILSSYIT